MSLGFRSCINYNYFVECMSHVISTKSSVKVDVDAKPTATIIRAPNGWPGRARFGLVPVGLDVRTRYVRPAQKPGWSCIDLEHGPNDPVV